MAGTLYLHLTNAGDSQFLWLTDDGVSGQGSLREAAEQANGRRLVVLVPGSQVLLLEAQVPTRNRERLLKAIPFALEEQLTVDVDTLHFALGRSTPAGIGVAVVARSILDDWLAVLTREGLAPHALVPDILALPWQPDCWTLVRDTTAALLRTGPQGGIAIEESWLTVALEATLEQAGGSPPRELQVIDSVPQLPPLPELGVAVSLFPAPAHPLEPFVTGYQEGQSINLLQGSYSRHEQLHRLWRPWRAAAGLLFALAIVQLADQIVEYQQLTNQEAVQKTQLARLYTEAFPDARKVVNPRAQMETRLKSLRSTPLGGGGESLLGLLERSAPVLAQAGGTELKALRYKEGGVELDLSLKNLQLLDRLKQQLTEAGLAVEIRSARAQGDTVEGRLQLRIRT